MSNSQRSQTAPKSIAADPSTLVQEVGSLGNSVPRFVTQAGASHLLAIPQEEVRRISLAAGLGRVERAGNEEVTYFTYDELYRVGMLAAESERATQ